MTSETSWSVRDKVLIRYQALFVALILFLATTYLLPERSEGLVPPLVFTSLALAALATAAEKHLTLIIGLLLAGPSLLASWLEPTEPTWAVAGGVFQVLFLAWVSFGILGHVLRASRVSADILFGVACVYVLLAIIWALGYGIADTIEPGALALTAEDAGRTADLHSLAGEKIRMYFSVVTLTTLGYGDVRPVSDAARIMAMLEATLGQLFLVIVVARIVGLHTVQMRGAGESGSSG